MGAPAGLSNSDVRLAPRVLLVGSTHLAGGADALAAALAVCVAAEDRAALLAEVGEGGSRRPTLLASAAARRCEAQLGGTAAGAAARGLLCHLAAGEGEEGIDRAADAAGSLVECSGCVVRVTAPLWQAALEHPRLRPCAAVIRADLPRERSLTALAVCDLHARRLQVRVATRPMAWTARRRALAGVRVGGDEEARLRRWLRLLLAERTARI
jgi:hypothetical protein